MRGTSGGALFRAPISRHDESAARRRAWARVVISFIGGVCALALVAPPAAFAASMLSGVLRDTGTSAPITSGDVAMSLERLQPSGTYAAVANGTAVSGSYSFPGLDAGTYRLVQVGPSPFSYFPAARNPGPAIAVDGTGDVIADWPLTRTGFGGGLSTITGNVVDGTTHAVITGSVTWVWLDEKAPDGTWGHVGDSYSSDGTYSFALLGPGVYRVRFLSAPAGYQLGGSGTSYPITLDGSGSAAFDWIMIGAGESGPTNHSPVASATSVAAVQNVDLPVYLPATDGDGDALTYSIISGPAHGTLGPIADNKVAYTPAAGYTGTDSFTFSASDGKASSNVAAVSINVEYANKGTGPGSWAAPTPAVGGVVNGARPTISIPIYDAAGFKGYPYFGVKVDGKAQLPVSLTLADPTHGTLTYSPNAKASLAPGGHVAWFQCMNGAGVWSTYSWSFTVVGP